MHDVLLVIAAGGALFNSWQIARLSGRVDALESTMRTVLAGRSPEAAHGPSSPSWHGERLRFEDLDHPSRKNIPTAEFEPVLAPVDQKPMRAAWKRRNRDLGIAVKAINHLGDEVMKVFRV